MSRHRHGRIGRTGSRRRSRSYVRTWIIAGGVALLGLVLWTTSGSGGQSKASHLNILLITIDTLRWDHVGAYGSDRASTPVLDSLAKRGAKFATAVAHVALTGPSHASMLTGLIPPRHGVRDN